jgi:hypothetical protein
MVCNLKDLLKFQVGFDINFQARIGIPWSTL